MLKRIWLKLAWVNILVTIVHGCTGRAYNHKAKWFSRSVIRQVKNIKKLTPIRIQTGVCLEV
jgi:hypothetical protein